MKVKLFYVSGDYYDELDEYIAKSVKETEWDEIDDKDWNILYNAVRDYRNTAYERLVVVTPALDITPALVASKFIEKEKNRIEKRRLEEEKNERKREESRKKRELKKLEKLKKKYEE